MVANKIKIYVGDVSEYLSSTALKEDASAQLLTQHNFKDLSPGTYYVSIGDLSNLADFGKICDQAHEIVYCPPKVWSDGNNSSMKKWTEDYLSIFACDPDKKIHGFNINCDDLVSMTHLADKRKSQEKQIWIAGCSISHGDGVGPQKRYGQLLSDTFKIPASFLTLPGSSISWAADQLLRSDIKSGDIIFWGLTSPNRFFYWNEVEKKIERWTTTTEPGSITSWHVQKRFLKQYVTEKFIISDIPVHQSVSSIYQVINFCNKINAQLVLCSLLRGIEKYLVGVPNFLPLAGLHGRDKDNIFLDVGDDKIHPGVKSHQYYADKMLEKFYKLYVKS